MNFETVYPRGISLVAFGGDERGVDLEYDVVERSAKVGPIDGGMARRFRIVDILTPCTV